MKIMLAGGGTGGHVYPALSVADALPRRAAGESVRFLLLGTARGDGARLAAAAGIPFVEGRAAPVRGRSPAALARSAAELAAGVVHAWKLIGRYRPGALLATGGYASVPASIAAWGRRVPLVLYLPDVYPGWAARLIARLATRITTTADGAVRHLPAKKVVVTGYPIREAFFTTSRADARHTFGLDLDERVLLVTGASQGSHALNAAVFDALPELTARYSVLHQTGAADLVEARRRRESLPESCAGRYRPIAYIDDMPAAMVAADLAVMRSGASALAEPPAAGLPAILVPGTFAGAHQRFNAAYMQEQGAAVTLDETELARLGRVVGELLDDRGRLAGMAAAMSVLARRDAAEAIADVVLGVAR